MYPSHMYPDHNNYLHLNSLWSIWYGVLLTLFQGYLAVHGAYRFLGCSLISWKIEPVTELNLQIVLSGVVFILLPFFFTSAVFKNVEIISYNVLDENFTSFFKCHRNTFKKRKKAGIQETFNNDM
uniref:Uncharacterized protein n=1 Tax=Glossina austeni TaxID=7395 RepID=A0A1A9VPF8_GLOAU